MEGRGVRDFLGSPLEIVNSDGCGISGSSLGGRTLSFGGLQRTEFIERRLPNRPHPRRLASATEAFGKERDDLCQKCLGANALEHCPREFGVCVAHLLLPWLPVVMAEATWKRPIRHRRP
jgi:hypothetical protein